MKINIASNEIIHFIGIGGIGMSGLAQIMNNMGFNIQGSDLNRNKNTDRLVRSRIKVYFGHHQKNLNKATMIVISSAVKKNNGELIAARHKKLSIFKRGEMLANIVALKKNIVMVPVVASVLVGTFTGVKYIVNLTDTINANQAEIQQLKTMSIENVRRDMAVLTDNVNTVIAKLERAEGTWEMAENLYEVLADKVRQMEYDIKDLNREINY